MSTKSKNWATSKGRQDMPRGRGDGDFKNMAAFYISMGVLRRWL